MKFHTAPALLSVLMVATLLLPAGAIFGTVGAPSEDVFDGEPSVEMAAHDGPNGAYVESTEDGELRIDFADPGVNPEALTSVERVFDLQNTDTTDVEVWVTHDGDERVTLFRDATGESIDGEAEAVTLGPGEEITVSFDIDSEGASAGEELLSTVTLHAGFESEPETETEPGPGPGPGTGDDTEPTEPTEPEEEPIAEPDDPVPDGVAEVEFDDDADADPDEPTETGVRTRTADVTELDGEDIDRPPLAVINSDQAETRAGVETGEGAGDAPTEDTTEDGEVTDAPALDDPDAEAFDTQTVVGEPAELTGERSTVGAAEGVSTRDRIVQLAEISVPPERQDQPATVRMRADLDRFGDGDPEEATIGHRTDDGWELLDTRVVDQTEDEVILETRTRGFSMFAVFAEANVQYEWELPDGTVLEGREIDPTFEEPGIYDVELTVTDRFGRESTATHRVLANDVPEATIEIVDRDGDEVTLGANVENEMGETDLTWTFPDGTEMTGEEVTHTLEEGEHEVRVHVVDEYGAESETEETVAVGPPGASMEAVADALGMDLELLVQAGALSGVGLAVAVVFRRFPWGVLARNRRKRLKITAFGDSTVDAAGSQFVIDELAIESPGRDIDRIDIRIVDSADRAVVRKQLDLSGTTTYTATPETITVPPGVSIDETERYTLVVKAVDTDGYSTERSVAVTAETELGFETSRTGRLSAQPGD